MTRALGQIRGVAGESNPLDLVCASASMRTGALLEQALPEPVRERLEGLAATLPDLFGTLDPTCLDRIAERLGGEPGDATFTEILLLSDKMPARHPTARRTTGGRPGRGVPGEQQHRSRAVRDSISRRGFGGRVSVERESSRMLPSIPAGPGLIASVLRLLGLRGRLAEGSDGRAQVRRKRRHFARIAQDLLGGRALACASA